MKSLGVVSIWSHGATFWHVRFGSLADISQRKAHDLALVSGRKILRTISNFSIITRMASAEERQAVRRASA